MAKFDALELIQYWKKRRREILESLPPEQLREYRQLGVSIKLAYKGIAGAVQEKMNNLHTKDRAVEAPSGRVPFHDRKKQIVDYLRDKGPSHRGEIIAETGIPAGSLSVVLQDADFENVGRGLWKAKDKK
jgi:hypothetical protein